MTDVLYPDWSNKSARSYTKTTLGEPYERGQEPTILLSPLDVLAIQVWAEAMGGQDAGTVGIPHYHDEKDPA